MPVIAIDGPGGAGKSTVSRLLAEHLGLEVLDTGAMYRAVTLLALRHGLAEAPGSALGPLAEAMELCATAPIRLGGEEVGAALRSAAVEAAVSHVAAQAEVRRELVRRQRDWVARRGGAVVEGRDIGSVVFPEAEVKVYLTAAPTERARRRAAERDALAEVEAVAERIAARDSADSSRAASPLLLAPGAVLIDSTGRRPEAVAEEILRLL